MEPAPDGSSGQVTSAPRARGEGLRWRNAELRTLGATLPADSAVDLVRLWQRRPLVAAWGHPRG